MGGKWQGLYLVLGDKMSERVWIPLSDNRPASNEIVFATPDSSGDYVLNSTPVWVAMGFQDVVTVRAVVDFDDWFNGREDFGKWEEWEEQGAEEALPFVTALKARSERITLVFEISGSAKAKVLNEISAALGQQCLTAGADGEGVGENAGLVGVPSEFCQTHTAAWRWLFEQFAKITPELSKSARRALAKKNAWLAIYFAIVPQMSTDFIPGLRGSISPGIDGSFQQVNRQAHDLEVNSDSLSAVRLLERSAYEGNPHALVGFMMRAITNGMPGWALAAEYWFSIGGFWDDQPSHIDDDEWDKVAEVLQPTVHLLGGLAHLYTSDPAWEPQVLLGVGTAALSVGDLAFASLACSRSTELQPVNWAIAPLMWIELMRGNAEKAIAVFDSKYEPRFSAPAMPRLESNPMFDDVLAVFKQAQQPDFQEEERLNLLTNAGLAYALIGNQEKAVEFWNQASQSAQARLFLAVLPAFNGDVAQGVEEAKRTLSRRDWAGLEPELEEAFGLSPGQTDRNFRRWFDTVREIQLAIGV